MAAGGEQTRSAHARDVSLGARIPGRPNKVDSGEPIQNYVTFLNESKQRNKQMQQ